MVAHYPERSEIKALMPTLDSLENAVISGTFIIQYVEGAFARALRTGEWVLLDEVNLASESLLRRVESLLG